MITTAELLERKAKAEKDLIMAQATISVVDELLSASIAKDQPCESIFCEETVEETESVDESY